MRVLIIGGSGTIGEKVAEALAPRHEVIIASRSNAKFQVDITFTRSILHLFETIGTLDACISTTASGALDNFSKLTEEELLDNMKAKLFGQINLVLIGQHYLKENGSFTLTSGIFADRHAKGATGRAIINSALNSFTETASLELPKNQRINIVSPGPVIESIQDFGQFFPDIVPIPMEKIVRAYVESVEGDITGQVFRIYK
jgi:NAD(P)-dependent dehydrogenase (short-subunit alcohol dehydrogenase family)